MCLILFAYKAHPNYRLVVAANRDEFYARPTAPLGFWEDYTEVLAGRDLAQKGTWMGVTAGGRFSAITNFRDPQSIKAQAPSRGQLVSDYLIGKMNPKSYLEQLAATANRYNGFNLLVGDADQLCYYSNYGKGIRCLAPGIYGLSNHLLDTNWPKVARGKKQLTKIIHENDDPSDETLFLMLQDQTAAADEHLPNTGVDLAWERMLSPIFITSPEYGTRSSSVLKIDLEGRIKFSERTRMPNSETPQQETTRCFSVANAIKRSDLIRRR